MKRIIFSAAAIALSFCTINALAAADHPMKTGEDVYKGHCAVCHMSGVANAPKVHDQKDWGARMDKAVAAVKKANPGIAEKDVKAKAIAYLMGNVKKGLGAMPAGGMCPKCTDKQYTDAIEFMMSKKKGS